jgi:hypothetical protein
MATAAACSSDMNYPCRRLTAGGHLTPDGHDAGWHRWPPRLNSRTNDQVPNLPAQRRLLSRQHGPPEVQMLRHAREAAEVAELDRRADPVYRILFPKPWRDRQDGGKVRMHRISAGSL